jgi:hypothetical protein
MLAVRDELAGMTAMSFFEMTGSKTIRPRRTCAFAKLPEKRQ